MDETAVVTCFLRNGTDVLLLRRSEAVGSYAGQWGAVAGHAEGDPDAAARAEVREETGLGDAVEFVRAGDPLLVADAERGTRWRVHPYLFDCDTREVAPNYETAEHEWAPPTALLDRATVPALDRSYAAVAPTVATVRADREHGSAYLSVRALEVLRDAAAGLTADPDAGSVAATARELVAARGMAALRTRVDRAMYEAGGGGQAPDPAAVTDAAAEGIDAALDADAAAAAAAAERLGDRTYTLSRSGTVREALRRAGGELLLPESRPGGEGEAVAAALAEDCAVTLTTDAAGPGRIAAGWPDAVLVGADAVDTEGNVVNKVGTHAAALAAESAGVPLLVACSRDKMNEVALDREDAGPLSETVDSWNPVFERTPADLVDAYLTEAGALDEAAARDVAAANRRLAAWRS
jgi:translation initiation factor 2B subunit (eIF-2B alpha/beta/delta family)/8-oxo-dGTP pyrophosphatase MutT (NUDIX family)